MAGFTKAYKRERPEALVKAVDFGGQTAAEIAAALVAETLGDPGCVEVGYQDGLRYTVTLEEQSAADGRPGMVLDKDSVFLVTGAAGGITSAIVTDLAAASGGTFYLLDLVPVPDAGDPAYRTVPQGPRGPEAAADRDDEGGRREGHAGQGGPPDPGGRT